MGIRVLFSDGTERSCESKKDAEDMILEAFAEGVTVDWVSDTENESRIYSCLWNVQLQGEW